MIVGCLTSDVKCHIVPRGVIVAMFKPIENQSVTRTVIQRIRSALLSGKLKPGDKLPSELELAKQAWSGTSFCP